MIGKIGFFTSGCLAVSDLGKKLEKDPWRNRIWKSRLKVSTIQRFTKREASTRFPLS